MPRQTQLRTTQRGVLDPISRPQSTRVVARPTDQYEAPAVDHELLGLVNGLTTLNPELQRYGAAVHRADSEKFMKSGAAAAAKGEELDKDSPEYFKHGYMDQRGQISGDDDGRALREAIATEFDMDTGDIDGFIRDKVKALTKGVQDKSYLEGYNKTLTKHLQDIRQGYHEYHQQKTIQTVESDAMKRLDNYMRPFVQNGGEIPDDGIAHIRGELKDYFKVSGTRFNDLLFTSLRRLGDEGNPEVYNILKRDRPDGTPGMYYIPGWKEKIDQAQIHADNVARANASRERTMNKEAREEKQGAALFEVFRLRETDQAAADALFNQKVSEGLITDAKEYHSWKNMYMDMGKKEASAEMLILETELQRGIYSGTVGMDQIAASDLTPQQKRSLFNEAYRVRSDSRREAREAKQDVYAVFKTQSFSESESYINTILRPTPSPFDVNGVGNEFQRGQLADARRQLYEAALRVKDPSELREISHQIVTSAQERAKDPRVKQELAGAGRIRYASPVDAQAAYRQGNLSISELETHINYYEALQRDKRLNGSR